MCKIRCLNFIHKLFQNTAFLKDSIFKWFGCICCLMLLIQSAYASKLVIGTVAYKTPFLPKEDSMFLSFETVLMTEICKRIHVDCEFKKVSHTQLAEEMKHGSIDLALGSIIITKEKRKQFLFSLPYQASTMQYVVARKSKIKTIQELTGTTIGVHLHCPTRNMALKHVDSTIQVNKLPETLNLISALEAGQVSAVLTDYHQAKQWAHGENKVKLLGYKFHVGDGYGIMTKIGRNDLIDSINQALLDIEEDGTYLKFYQEYL